MNSQTLPPHLDSGNNESKVVLTTVEDNTRKVVMFVGDILPNSLKQAAMYRRGGKIVNNPCLRDGFLERCAMVTMNQGMMAVHRNMLDPKEAKNNVQNYTATNIWNAVTGRYENVEVGKSGAGLGLVFKPIYPVQEVGNIAGKNDGTIVLPNLNSAADVREAQYFYFPNWTRIALNQDLLPDRVRDLEAHIRERMAKAISAEAIAVGDAILNGLAQYRQWGTAYVAYQTARIKESEKMPGSDIQQYDEIAERLFVALELTRQDSLISDMAIRANKQAESDGELKTAISLIAQLLAGQQASSGALINQTAPAPSLEQQTIAPQVNAENQIAPPPFSSEESEIISGPTADQKDETTEGSDANKANDTTTTTPNVTAPDAAPKPKRR